MDSHPVGATHPERGGPAGEPSTVTCRLARPVRTSQRPAPLKWLRSRRVRLAKVPAVHTPSRRRWGADRIDTVMNLVQPPGDTR